MIFLRYNRCVQEKMEQRTGCQRRHHRMEEEAQNTGEIAFSHAEVNPSHWDPQKNHCAGFLSLRQIPGMNKGKIYSALGFRGFNPRHLHCHGPVLRQQEGVAGHCSWKVGSRRAWQGKATDIVEKGIRKEDQKGVKS